MQSVAQYVARRILLGFFVVIGIIFITFFLSHVIPSNPAALWAGAHPTAQEIAAAKRQLHLNDPLYVQFYYYLANFVHGNLGVSIRTHNPVLSDIIFFLPNTLTLITLSLVFSALVGIPLGVVSAVKEYKAIDYAARIFAIAGIALPTFWLGMVLQLLFNKELNLLPVGGYISVSISYQYPIIHLTGSYLLDSLITGNFPAFLSVVKHLILPVLTLASYPTGLVIRQTRAGMLEVLEENYIKTSKAYGIENRVINFRYALKNAINPVLIVLSLSFAYSLIGAFYVEDVFALPGLGQYATQSILSLDYPAILGVTIVVTIFYVVINLVVDVLQYYTDRRITL
ncbi:MAG: ABC transporter permease [Nitrososphaerota archaeon]